MALSGGYVFVSTSLLTAAENEVEFAGMLAHAMAHVANRDGTRMATQSQLINYGSIPLIFMGGWSGGSTGAGDSHAAIPLGFLKTQRSFELHADREAVRAMAATAYDPKALVRYLSRMPPPDSVLFSSLPPREERLASLEAAIRQLPLPEFERVRNQLKDPRVADPARPVRPVPSLRTPDGR
jgi:predicted Zn-dependent protease